MHLSVSVWKRTFLIRKPSLFHNMRYQDNVSTSVILVNDIQQVVVDVFWKYCLPKPYVLYSSYTTMSESTQIT